MNKILFRIIKKLIIKFIVHLEKIPNDLQKYFRAIRFTVLPSYSSYTNYLLCRFHILHFVSYQHAAFFRIETAKGLIRTNLNIRIRKFRL